MELLRLKAENKRPRMNLGIKKKTAALFTKDLLSVENNLSERRI
ncbi:hypothetical protein [Paraburkholderia monticola]|nr:hypothetical protein [Paraburkholderia monticola]